MIQQVEEMSDLRVAPGFRRIYARVFGILASQAIDAARRHDKVETVQMDDLEVRVYAKFVRSVKPAPHVNRSATSLRWRKTLDASLNAEIPTFLIVVEVGGVICSALRVYEDLHPQLAAKSPLEILALIVEGIGLELRVGETRSKLILNQHILVSKGRPERLVRVLSSRRSEDQWIWKLDAGPPMVANCALCFSIDIDAYRRYLRRDS